MINPGSFRDPAGFVFTQRGRTLRQVNRAYAEQYDHLMTSGLHDRLTADGLLVRHREHGLKYARTDAAYRIIQPQQVPFISYPYEWSFGQLKAAALHTLDIQRVAMEYGMTLKDASAYNVQFFGGRPVLIDTLSFDFYREGQVWLPYRQFVQHFLAPLALMALVDASLGGLFRVHIDGVPLSLASSLLPMRSRLNFGLTTHIHLHAKGEKSFAGRAVSPGASTPMDRKAFTALIDNLTETVEALNWKPEQTPWADYYSANSYDEQAFDHKGMLLRGFLGELSPRVVWDMGANTGYFSRVAAETGAYVVAFDADPGAVELNYQQVREHDEKKLLPLLMDLTNPSPALGWANRERRSLGGRANADTLLALALVHHLAIGNNLPLPMIAAYFARLAPSLVVEFIPKTDPMVIALLNSRQDIFDDYTQEGFEAAFERHYHIDAAETVRPSARVMYMMRRREGADGDR